MDPQQVYQEVLDEEAGKGTPGALAKARAEAAAERARLGSPNPKQAKFWAAEPPPQRAPDRSVETEAASAPVAVEEVEKKPPERIAERAKSDAPPVSPSSAIAQAEDKPEDEAALQSQWDTQAAIDERRELMAKRQAEIKELIETGVPAVTAAEVGRESSAASLVLYLLIPLIAIVAFVSQLGGNNEPAAPEKPSASAGAPGGGASLTDITVTASGLAFDTNTITLKAGSEDTIHFTNQDDPAIQHNISIYNSEKATKNFFQGPLIAGGSSKDYAFKGPPAGTYFFRCDEHPTTMTGTAIFK